MGNNAINILYSSICQQVKKQRSVLYDMVRRLDENGKFRYNSCNKRSALAGEYPVSVDFFVRRIYDGTK